MARDGGQGLEFAVNIKEEQFPGAQQQLFAVKKAYELLRRYNLVDVVQVGRR
jgi:hypothetical protein